jgi:hypothetical protein
MKFSCVSAALIALFLLAGCAANPPATRPATASVEPAPLSQVPTPPAAPPLPMGASQLVPAGSVLEVAIQAEINTRVAKATDHFPITVARGLELGGYTVIPAGAPGHGEIVHAQRSGSFGKPAELLLAVRWIEVNGQRIEMRHFRPHTGKDKTTTAGNLTMVPVAGLFSPFIRGGEIVLPVGTVAIAQVRADTHVEGSAAPTDAHTELSPAAEISEP